MLFPLAFGSAFFRVGMDLVEQHVHQNLFQKERKRILAATDPALRGAVEAKLKQLSHDQIDTIVERVKARQQEQFLEEVPSAKVVIEGMHIVGIVLLILFVFVAGFATHYAFEYITGRIPS